MAPVARAAPILGRVAAALGDELAGVRPGDDEKPAVLEVEGQRRVTPLLVPYSYWLFVFVHHEPCESQREILMKSFLNNSVALGANLIISKPLVKN